MKHLPLVLTLGIACAFLMAACESSVLGPESTIDETTADARAPALDNSYELPGAMIFDIAATPNGSILFGAVEPHEELLFGPNTIHEIGRRGITDVSSIPTPPGSPINGLEPIGQRNFYAATGGGDRTVGAGLWRASQGNERLVGDISSFTLGSFDFRTGEGEPGPYPDAWKDQRCEPFLGPFSPGPQTNPYHLAAKNGGEVIVADAANNGVLRVRTNGQVEVVAFMDPAVLPGDDSGNPENWLELGTFDLSTNAVGFPGENLVEYDLGEGEITCYVEPVPTAVAIGSDGAYYVSELTGNTPQNFNFTANEPHDMGEPSPEGLARIWRIEPGARDVRCPSSECVEVEVDIDLNALIDIEFGPDGKLYLVEFDRHGAAVGFELVEPGLGSVQRCDVDTGTCDEAVAENLVMPGAISFDKSGTLWLVENVYEPTVRQVDY